MFRRVISLGVLILLASITGLTAAQEGGDPVQVGVIVWSPARQLQTFCITLNGDNPTGLDALQATGLDLAVESGPLGATVCRIGADGCDPSGDPCFCMCMPGDDTCVYWTYLHLGAEGNWQYSPAGASGYPVSQGAVEGWWWREGDPSAAMFPALPFDVICPSEPVFPRTVTDGLDREVTLDAPPQHIASVTLGSDEILLSLVGSERVLGVTDFAGDPAISNVVDQLDEIPYTDLTGDPEYLISLDADLIILAAYNNPAALDQLEDAGLPLFVLGEFNTLDDIRTNIRLLGQITGEEARAEIMIAEMDARLAAIQARVAGQDSVRVLYYEPGGISYGPGSTVDEIITLAGGVNVIAEADLGAYPLVDAEFVLAADPDVILLGGWFSGAEGSPEWFTGDAAFSTLRAVQDGRVYPIIDAHMTNVSQYVVLGVEDVARALYPSVFD